MTIQHVRHICGPTTDFPREGLMFYERRCTRCGTLLDMGRINPTVLYETGMYVVREEHHDDHRFTVHYSYQTIAVDRNPTPKYPIYDCHPHGYPKAPTATVQAVPGK